MEEPNNSSHTELLFFQLVSMFQMAAMQQMGKLVNPVTSKVERDLGQAKVSIDILDVIKEKTQGNLSEAEEEFLGKALFELHMNYVDELKSADGKSQEAERKSTHADESSGAGDKEADAGATAAETDNDGDDG